MKSRASRQDERSGETGRATQNAQNIPHFFVEVISYLVQIPGEIANLGQNPGLEGEAKLANISLKQERFSEENVDRVPDYQTGRKTGESISRSLNLGRSGVALSA